MSDKLPNDLSQLLKRKRKANSSPCEWERPAPAQRGGIKAQQSRKVSLHPHLVAFAKMNLQCLGLALLLQPARCQTCPWPKLLHLICVCEHSPGFERWHNLTPGQKKLWRSFQRRVNLAEVALFKSGTDQKIHRTAKVCERWASPPGLVPTLPLLPLSAYPQKCDWLIILCTSRTYSNFVTFFCLAEWLFLGCFALLYEQVSKNNLNSDPSFPVPLNSSLWATKPKINLWPYYLHC